MKQFIVYNADLDVLGVLEGHHGFILDERIYYWPYKVRLSEGNERAYNFNALTERDFCENWFFVGEL